MELIDRQAAIEFIAAGKLVNPNEPRWSDNEVVGFLKSRPTIAAEPVKRESEWKWCHDCKEYDQENHCCHRWSTVIRDTVEEMQIIRCKDCINFTRGKDEWGSCFENPMKMWRDTDYCSWAERRTDAH